MRFRRCFVVLHIQPVMPGNEISVDFAESERDCLEKSIKILQHLSTATRRTANPFEV
jgi:hypothetical protein